MSSLLRVNAANTARTKPTTGDTKMSFVNADHLGWVKCDGRALNKVKYNLLFQVLGSTFGSDALTFNLPNPAGRVMGSIGTVVDDASRTRTYVAGQSVGELDHKLTVNEMPAHNHNKSVASPGANTTADGVTSVEANHTHGITDPGHTHTYTSPANADISGSGLVTFSAGTTSGTTSSNTTGITVDPAGSHSHTISSNGNDEYHNNIQPTLFYGNTFIYCGNPMLGEFPFKTGLAPVLI